MVNTLLIEERTVRYFLLLPQTTGPEIDERLRCLLDGERDFERLKRAVPVDIDCYHLRDAFKDLLERNLFLGSSSKYMYHRILERALHLDGDIEDALHSLIKNPSGKVMASSSKGSDYVVDLRHIYCLFLDSDFQFYVALARDRGMDENVIKQECTTYLDTLERLLLALYTDFARALNINVTEIEGVAESGSGIPH